MWITEDFVDNDLFEMIRDEGGDQALNVQVSVSAREVRRAEKTPGA